MSLFKIFARENIKKVVSKQWLVVRDEREIHIRLVGGRLPLGGTALPPTPSSGRSPPRNAPASPFLSEKGEFIRKRSGLSWHKKERVFVKIRSG